MWATIYICNKLKTLVTLKLIKIIVMPCNQIISIRLTQSTDPSDTMNPTDPTDPSDTMNPTDPTDPSDTMNPTDPTDPSDTMNPTDPTDPSDTINQTNSTDPTDPSDPMNQTNSTDSIINTSCNGEYDVCTGSQVSVLVKFNTKYGSSYHINIIAYQIAASCVTCSDSCYSHPTITTIQLPLHS